MSQHSTLQCELFLSCHVSEKLVDHISLHLNLAELCSWASTGNMRSNNSCTGTTDEGLRQCQRKNLSTQSAGHLGTGKSTPSWNTESKVAALPNFEQDRIIAQETIAVNRIQTGLVNLMSILFTKRTSTDTHKDFEVMSALPRLLTEKTDCAICPLIQHSNHPDILTLYAFTFRHARH